MTKITSSIWTEGLQTGKISLGELLSSTAFSLRLLVWCVHGVQNYSAFCFKVGICLHLVPKQSLLQEDSLKKSVVFWKGSCATTAVHRVEAELSPSLS